MDLKTNVSETKVVMFDKEDGINDRKLQMYCTAKKKKPRVST